MKWHAGRRKAAGYFRALIPGTILGSRTTFSLPLESIEVISPLSLLRGRFRPPSFFRLGGSAALSAQKLAQNANALVYVRFLQQEGRQEPDHSVLCAVKQDPLR